MTSGTPVVLLGDTRPDSLFLDQMYDPDIHDTSELANGKIVPHEGSLVIVRDTRQALVVMHVDETTYKATLMPVRIIVTNEEEDTYVVSYGNERFLLLYDDRVNPTQLTIDSKLVIYGRANCEYRLIEELPDGKERVISTYLDADGKFVSDRIPMTEFGDGSTGAKQGTNCHTLFEMVDGNQVRMEVYNRNGILSATIILFTIRATIQNDLASSSNPIVGFTAECLQKRSDDEWYIYEDQDPDHLGITVTLHYANSVADTIGCDGNKCRIYGLDDYIPSYPGHRRRILIKYFLSNQESSTINTTSGQHRFLLIEKDLVVVSNATTYSMKLACVPSYDSYLARWSLRWFAYTELMDNVKDVTDLVSYDTYSTFDPTKYNLFQRVQVSVALKDVFDTSAEGIYRQNTWILVRPGSQFDRFIIKDSEADSYVYGVEAPPTHRRPVIHYDTTLQQYFVPTSIFMNKEAVIESFYTKSRPMYNPNERTAPFVPTHFTVRNPVTGNVIVAAPIEIEQFDQAWNAVVSGQPNQFVGKTVIVEFLMEVAGQYQIIWGVPVDVHQSATGYNTVNNP